MGEVEETVKEAMGWTDKQLEVYKKMGAIVVAMNDIDIKDLEKLIHEIARDEAIGPMIDPTA